MLETLFGNAAYIPHGYCLTWAPGLVALHLISDGLIAAAYFSIPGGIFIFLRKRSDFPYRGLAYGFAVFIVCCGLTHLFSAATLWLPYYGVEGLMKAVTGVVSLTTAVALWPMIPKLISLPSPTALRDANERLQDEIDERRDIESELLVARETLEQAVQARTAALQATESRLRAAIEAAVNAVIVINRNGTIETFNRAAENMFGLTAEEAIGQNVKVLMPSEYASQHDGYLESYLRTGESGVIGQIRELTGRRSNGSEFPIELSVAEAVPNETFVGTVTDITTRKQAENDLLQRDRELAAQANLLQGVFDTISHGIAVRDRDMRMVTWNQKYQEMFPQPSSVLRPGVSFEEQVDFVARSGFGPMDPTIRESEVFTSQPASGDSSPELVFDTQDGRSITVSQHKMPDGRSLYMYTDITEVRQYQQDLAQRAEQLQRSNEELEQFAHVASHDLQEPLRMVRSYCELIKDNYADRLDEDGREFLEFAVDGANRMRGLIQDLLRLSRVGSGDVTMEIVDCNNLMRQVRDDLQASIDERDAQLLVEDLPVVRGNEALLRQVLQNLVSNALKFTKQDPVIVKVSARETPDYWEFSVEDNGIGIDPKFAERIFTIFQRLHTRDEFPGNGMGLAICRKIIDRHGGRIWLDTGHREGTRFLFSLPRRVARGERLQDNEQAAG